MSNSRAEKKALDKEKAAQKASEKEKAKRNKIRSMNKIKSKILDFYKINNLHCIVTDMVNKAFLGKSANPLLFMAQYLVDLNKINFQSFLQTKSERNLSDGSSSDSNDSSDTESSSSLSSDSS